MSRPVLGDFLVPAAGRATLHVMMRVSRGGRRMESAVKTRLGAGPWRCLISAGLPHRGPEGQTRCWGMEMRVLIARWVAGCAAAGSVALIAGGLALAYVDRHLLRAGLTAWNFSDVLGGVANLAVPVVGFVLASRRPANRVGWLFLAAGLALGLGGFLTQYGLRALVAAPGSLPAGRAFAWLSNWIWVVPFAMLAFVFLLFPTGQLRSRRWRLAAWFAGGVFALAAVDMVVNATRFWSDPFITFSQRGNPRDLTAVLILMAAALVVSVAAVVVRFARSTGDERLQLKWFAAAALLVVATLILPIVTSSVVVNVLNNLAFLCLWVAIGIAVLKYRLYEIDIVISKGDLLSAISIRMPKDEPLRPAGEQLVADVASQAGLVLSNAGLIEDLRASRQRLVAAQDEARRRLERNIHDGAQQDLVALAISLQLADVTVDEDPAQAKQILGELKADAAGALENLRDLARGIYPPLLADLGLAAALSAQASKSTMPVTVDADGIGRFPQDTEAAVYFCCLEALQNTAKYAHASGAQICLHAQKAASPPRSPGPGDAARRPARPDEVHQPPVDLPVLAPDAG